ncbi:hypothetical protein [Hydrogenophaga sp. NFH-34]|uniref:hypothetical protein n=1 Tax=Hydrogenophaga sp. NFH-34 TaxID=2744446 RepID=UPI001F190FCD|nr:hypothetical protein [Hydrogenophaga sp. NFH-34]
MSSHISIALPNQKVVRLRVPPDVWNFPMGCEGPLEITLISNKQAQRALEEANDSVAHPDKVATAKQRLASTNLEEDLPGLYFYGGTRIAVVGDAHVLEALLEAGVYNLPVVILSNQREALASWLEYL